MDYTVHEILQARILEWVAFPFSRRSSQPSARTQVSRIAGSFFYQLSHRGSPRILEWVAYPFSRGSSWPRNQPGVSCIAGRFFTSWDMKEAQVVKNRLPMQETREMWVWSMGWEDLLEEVMVTHFSILAWRILWTEEPSGLQSMGHKGLDTTEVTWQAHMHTVIVNSSYIVSQLCFKWFKCPERDRKKRNFGIQRNMRPKCLGSTRSGMLFIFESSD